MVVARRVTFGLLVVMCLVNAGQAIHFRGLLETHAQSAHRDAVTHGQFDSCERRITRLEHFVRHSLGRKVEVDGKLYWGLVVSGGEDEPDLFVSPQMIAVRTDGKWSEVTND